MRAIQLSPRRWTSPPVTVNDTGGFTVSGLDAGDYMVCAMADPAKLLIDPCYWLEPPAKPVVVSAGRPTTGLTVRLTPGRRVAVRVKDPEGVLKDVNRKIPAVFGKLPPVLVVEMQGPPGGIVRRLGLTKTEPGEVSVHELVVPTSGPVKLRVQGQSVSLRDSQGRAFAASKHEDALTEGAADLEYEFEVGK